MPKVLDFLGSNSARYEIASVATTRESGTLGGSRKSCVQKADCARIAEKRNVNREGAGMALARVVSFDGVSKDRMEEMRGEMRGEPPEGLPATEVVVLHDPEAEKSLVVLFFESEDDYRRGDEVLNAMPAGDTPGQRSSVTKYEVAVRMTP